jgi:membrane protein
MSSFKTRATATLERARETVPLLDHVIRMVQHYGTVNGSMLAGGVTYFAFLSFFPILALAFFVIGYVARVYPDAQQDLVEAIGTVLPGMIGDGKGEISLASMSKYGGAAGLIGVLGLLYSGLSWVSGMRTALLAVFEKPAEEQGNFLVGYVRDLAALGVIGIVLVVSVGLSSVVTGFSEKLLALVGLGAELRPALAVLTVLVGLAANALLFFALFRLLAAPDTPRRSLWSGALLGALGFEALKWASTYLMASTKNQPAFQAFGIALILLVWINYFSRVVMYAAAWAHTSAAAPRPPRVSRSSRRAGRSSRRVSRSSGLVGLGSEGPRSANVGSRGTARTT